MAEEDVVAQLQKCSELVSSDPGLSKAVGSLLDQAMTLIKGGGGVPSQKAPQDEIPAEGVSLITMLMKISGATRLLNLRETSQSMTSQLSDILPADGVLVRRAAEIHGNNKVKSEYGSSKTILEKLAKESKEFDMILLDGRSETLIDDYEIVVKHHLLALNGIIVMFAADASSAVFSAHVTVDDRVEQVKLSISGSDVFIIQRRCTPTTQVSSAELDDVFKGAGRRNILQRFHLDGKVALVTGSGQGIGRAFAHALGEAGAKVVIVDLFEDRASHVCQELLDKGVDAMWLKTDVTKEDQVKKMVASVIDRWGALHIAFNNAGTVRSLSAEDHTMKDWNTVMDVNLNSMFMCCQAEYDVMAKQGYGKIVNTASMCSLIVLRPQKQVSYNVSKMGVLGLTRTLAVEWAEKGIRVNCISPGYVNTALTAGTLGHLRERWISEIPAGRMQEVTDLQGAAVFLASEASDYITGENLVVDGGKCTL